MSFYFCWLLCLVWCLMFWVIVWYFDLGLIVVLVFWLCLYACGVVVCLLILGFGGDVLRVSVS